MCSKKNQLSCPSTDISAYLDGELSSGVEIELEIHIAECAVCREELNLQKSFLNALGTSLDSENPFELPHNFTEVIVTSAESHISGLRQPHERRHAAFVCVGLAAFALLALGSGTSSAVAAVTGAAERVFAVASSVAHFAYDVALGSTIVFRSLASALVFDSAWAMAFLLALFVLSLFVFSRLIGGFPRT